MLYLLRLAMTFFQAFTFATILPDVFLIIIDLSKFLHFCPIITLDIIDINMSPEKGSF